jgi:hypothetical protein
VLWYLRVMEATGNGPDEVTAAALEAVSEATRTTETGSGRRRRRKLAGRIPGRVRGTNAIGQLRTAIAAAARRGAHVTRQGVTSGGRWLSAQVIAMAPRIPVRDVGALRAQFPGKSPDELAEALIDGAAKAAATVGAAVGAWAVLPFVPAAGAEIAAETLSVVGIEIKLVAELHEVYGMRAPGGIVDRMTAYVGAWSSRRGVRLAPGGLIIAAGSPLGRQLRRRLAARAGRSVFSLGPLLTGAVAGAMINRRETRKLGRAIRDDLRKYSPRVNGWPDVTGQVL